MPNDIRKLRRLMRGANILKKSHVAIFRGSLNMSQSLKFAWWFEHFRVQLGSGTYRFSYFKKNGEIREAKGTLNPELIPDEQKPHALGPESVTHDDTFPYYDLDANAWRSFRLDHFIGYVEQIA